MAIRIEPPVCLHEKGKRKNNEDSIYPSLGSGTDSDKLFLVCDGVGGANKGEVASAMVCDLLHTYFAEHSGKEVDAHYVGQALRFAEARMSKHTAAHPECGGMATTLTLLYLDDQRNKATIAWVGDSRVYHVRNGNIQYVTDDHSLVNELVKRGEINPEDAATHPQRNVILRAISGSDQPTKSDVKEIIDIQAGDYFMLCTDGILETIDDHTIKMLLPNAQTQLDIVKTQINELCDHLSNDNFSMYLLRVAEVSPAALPSANIVGKTGELKMPSQDLSKNLQNTATISTVTNAGESSSSAASSANNSTQTATPKPLADNRTIVILAAAALIAFMALGLYWLSTSGKEKQYSQFMAKADSLANEQQWDEAVTFYQKAAALFPDKKDVQSRISDIADKKQAQYFADSLQNEKNALLTDSVLLAKAKISSQTIEEADTAQLNIIKEKLDSARNASTTPIDRVIEQNATPPKNDTLR